MKIFSILFFIVLITANCRNNQTSNIPAKGQIEIEKINLTGLKGESIDLKQFKGKVVFVNFWATWCKPCVLEMPTIRNAMDSLRNENVEFLFASDESAEEIENFEKTHGYRFNYYRAVNIEELAIMILPTTFIFDKNGKQVYSEAGYHDWSETNNFDMLLKLVRQQ